MPAPRFAIVRRNVGAIFDACACGRGARARARRARTCHHAAARALRPPHPNADWHANPHCSLCPLADERNGGASRLENVKNGDDLLSRAYDGASLATYNGRTLKVWRGRRRGKEMEREAMKL